LGRQLAVELEEDELTRVVGGQVVATAPDDTSTVDPNTGEEND
jgi:hypothetical protein